MRTTYGAYKLGRTNVPQNRVKYFPVSVSYSYLGAGAGGFKIVFGNVAYFSVYS